MAATPARTRDNDDEGKSGRSALEKILSVFADTRRGEGPKALLLTLSVFLLLTSYYLLKTAREPLILEGGAEVKSYSSAGQALLLIPTTYLYGLLAQRVGRIKLISIVTLIFASNLFVFFGLHMMHVKIGVPFFLWVGVFNVMIVAQFWSFANDVYTEKQGKRLFAILGVGSTVGAVFGSFIAGRLVHPIGVYGLMLAAAGFLLASLAITVTVHRIDTRTGQEEVRADEKKEAKHDEPLGKEAGFKLLFADRYLLFIALLLFFLNCVNSNGEYILDRTLLAHLKDTLPAGVDAHAWTEEQLGIFKAHYFLYVNSATVVLQLFAVSRVIKYLGVRVGILILPLVSLTGYGSAFFFPVLSIIFAVKIAENTLDYSLQNTSNQALWLLTSRDDKYKAKNVVDSFIVRSGDCISAAITFTGSMLGFTTRHFIGINVVLVGVWLGVVVALGRLHKVREAKAEGTAPKPDTRDDRSRPGRRGPPRPSLAT